MQTLLVTLILCYPIDTTEVYGVSLKVLIVPPGTVFGRHLVGLVYSKDHREDLSCRQEKVCITLIIYGLTIMPDATSADAVKAPWLDAAPDFPSIRVEHYHRASGVDHPRQRSPRAIISVWRSCWKPTAAGYRLLN